MYIAKRLQPLSTNVFADMDKAKGEARAKGLEVIDLSLGSSDLPASAPVIDTIAKSLQDHHTHGYLLHNGTRDFRCAAAHWYETRFGVKVDPDTEVLQLIGSQEGTAHLPLALLDPGDYALLLDPGYPSHIGGVHLAGGKVHTMPLKAENDFLPVFADIPPEVLKNARLMVLSYPHNPTSATASLAFFRSAVDFCHAHNIALVHDFPYVDIYFDDTPSPPSVLQADPEKSLSIEFFTLSKSYNMGGFRVGFAIGNPDLILALKRIKAVVDFNQYKGILNGAIEALTGDKKCVKETVDTYRQRRDVLVSALKNIGWEVPTPKATLYLWAKLPQPWAQNSQDFCLKLVAETGVAVSPGSGFGPSGEGYVRFALVHPPEVLAAAAVKIGQFLQD